MLTFSPLKSKDYHEKNELKSEDYHDEKGHSPGRYIGAGFEKLGLTGNTTQGALAMLCDGIHPITKEKIFTVGKAKKKADGDDGPLNAPKDFTLLAEFDTKNKDKLEAIYRNAVDKTVELITKDIYRRVNSKNDRAYDVMPLIIVYDHKTARNVKFKAPDPHWHSHVIVLRKAPRFDNNTNKKFATISNVEIYRRQKIYGTFFRSLLAKGLRELNYETYMRDEKICDETVKSFGVVGITAEMRQDFSKRNVAMREELQGNNSFEAKSNFIHQNRETKQIWSKEELRKIWNDEAEEIGINSKLFSKISSKTVKSLKSIPTNNDLIERAIQLSNAKCKEKSSTKFYLDKLELAAVEQQQITGIDYRFKVKEIIETDLVKAISNQVFIKLPEPKIKNSQKTFTQKTKKEFVKTEVEISNKEKATTQKSEVARIDVVKKAKATIKKVSDKSISANVELPTKSKAKSIADLVSSYSVETIKNSIAHIAFQLNNPNLSTAEVARLMQLKSILMQQLEELEQKQKLKIS